MPAYGLERLRAAVKDLVDVRIFDPYLVAERPLEAVVELASRLQPHVVGLGLRVVEDCITIDRLEAPPDEPIDVAWFMPDIRRLRQAIGTTLPDTLLVLGGAAFSALPYECLDYLDVDYGVVGSGERTFRELVIRFRDGRPLDGIPGLVRRGEPGMLDRYQLPANDSTERDPLYAPANSFPLRTRGGCAMQCAYCLTANMRRSHSNVDLGAVLDELAAIISEAADRGISRVPIFFADDEFNLPDERHSIELLQKLVDRDLAKSIHWRAYFNPVPFSDELAALVKETRGHASITVDTAAESVMRRAQKPFRRRHLDELVESLVRHDIPADLGLIFGLPGETEETIAETVEFVASLPTRIEVVYAAGARVYPSTPLAMIASNEPERLVGSDDPTFFRPVVYSSPFPPRELARRLDDAFADLPSVRRVGVGFARGRRTVAAAYRAVLDPGDRRAWPLVLDEAEVPGEYGRSPAESLLAVLQVALWHRRPDLAAAAYRRLARQRVLPPGASRTQLRFAWLALRTLSLFDRSRPPRDSPHAPSGPAKG